MLKDHGEFVAITICLLGVVFDLVACYLGIGLRLRKNGTEAGLLIHLHMSFWHVFMVPVVIWVISNDFYRRLDFMVQDLAESALRLENNGRPLSTEEEENIFHELFISWRLWQACFFVVFIVLFAAGYAYNIYSSYSLPNHFGWMQIGLYGAGQYQGTMFPTELQNRILAILVSFGAVLSAWFLIHYVVAAAPVFLTVLNWFFLNKGESKNFKIKNGMHAGTYTVFFSGGKKLVEQTVKNFFEIYNTAYWAVGAALFFAFFRSVSTKYVDDDVVNISATLIPVVLITIALLFVIPMACTAKRYRIYLDRTGEKVPFYPSTKGFSFFLLSLWACALLITILIVANSRALSLNDISSSCLGIISGALGLEACSKALSKLLFGNKADVS